MMIAIAYFESMRHSQCTYNIMCAFSRCHSGRQAKKKHNNNISKGGSLSSDVSEHEI